MIDNNHLISIQEIGDYTTINEPRLSALVDAVKSALQLRLAEDSASAARHRLAYASRGEFVHALLGHAEEIRQRSEDLARCLARFRP